MNPVFRLFRHLLRAVFAVAVLLAAVPAGAQSSGTDTAARVSPYTQQRNPAYTSFDNPYATGGIYDPYRTTGFSSENDSAIKRSRRLSSESADLNGDSADIKELTGTGGLHRCGNLPRGMSGSGLAPQGKRSVPVGTSSGLAAERPGSATLSARSARCSGISTRGKTLSSLNTRRVPDLNQTDDAAEIRLRALQSMQNLPR